MRRPAIAGVALLAACRLGFDARPHATGGDDDDDKPRDAPPSLDAHLQASPSYQIAPLFDISAALPYRAVDFVDSDGSTDSNELGQIVSLGSPFTSRFAITGGRTLVEVAADGQTTVHDYRPAMPDTVGPDEVTDVAFATLGSRVGVYVTSTSHDSGDGVYFVDSTWAMTRLSTGNNSLAPVFDVVGAFGSAGTPTLYDVGNTVLQRSPDGIAFTKVHDFTPTQVFDLALTPSRIYVVRGIEGQIQLDWIGPNNAITHLADMTSLSFADGPAAPVLYAIRDGHQLVTIEDADFTEIARSNDPQWVWVSATLSAFDVAGAPTQVIVLETDRALGEARLVTVTLP